MENQDGFTLLELCIVVCIVGISLLFSYPSIASWKNDEILKGEIRQMATTLMRAKLQAIQDNKYVVVQFTDDGYSAFIDDGSGGGKAKDWILQPGEKIIEEHTMVRDLRLETNFSSNRTRFRGRLGVSGGTITLTSNQKKYANVVLALTGRVRVEKF